MRIKKFILAVLLLVVSICFGCAEGIIGATKPTVPLETFKTVSITVTGAGDITDAEKNELKDDIVKCLKEEGKWIPAERGDLLINVNITDLSRSNPAKVAFVLAGLASDAATCKVDIALLDAKGTAVSSFSVVGSSGILGTDTAINNTAKYIVEYLKTAK